MNTPDPEHSTENETEVEITDLDAGEAFQRETRRHGVRSWRVRTWMNIAIIGGLVLLVVSVLRGVLQLPQAAKVTTPRVPINYPVTLSVVDGICYIDATNGVVTARRVTDGRLLWHHMSGKTGTASLTVAEGVVYLVPFFPYYSDAATTTLEALRASDGALLWSRTLPRDALTSFQLTVMKNVVYIRSMEDTIEALRTSDGALLWRSTALLPFVSTVADGMVYTLTQDDHLAALYANSGVPRWTYTSPTPVQPMSPVVADGMILLSLQNGAMDAVRATTGVVLWHYPSHAPALASFPHPLVVNGVVYVLTQDGHLSALRASSGSLIWSAALFAHSPFYTLFATDGVIYVEGIDGDIDALNIRSGSILWSFQGENGELATMSVADTVIYLAYATTGINAIGSVAALQTSNGLVIWYYTPHVSATQLEPAVEQHLVLLPSQDGSIDAFDANSGSLLWRSTMNS